MPCRPPLFLAILAKEWGRIPYSVPRIFVGFQRRDGRGALERLREKPLSICNHFLQSALYLFIAHALYLSDRCRGIGFNQNAPVGVIDSEGYSFGRVYECDNKLLRMKDCGQDSLDPLRLYCSLVCGITHDFTLGDSIGGSCSDPECNDESRLVILHSFSHFLLEPHAVSRSSRGTGACCPRPIPSTPNPSRIRCSLESR
jgi:hypothetical protein